MAARRARAAQDQIFPRLQNRTLILSVRSVCRDWRDAVAENLNGVWSPKDGEEAELFREAMRDMMHAQRAETIPGTLLAGDMLGWGSMHVAARASARRPTESVAHGWRALHLAALLTHRGIENTARAQADRRACGAQWQWRRSGAAGTGRVI